MIKAIYLTNFQSHKHSELELHEGVNVIVGPSDSGKTAILRALNWVLRNRPSGEAFRSHWGGDTDVVIRTEEATIGRLRSKSRNEYVVGLHEHDQTFKAVGRDVPEEILQLLNMDDINIQSQMDAPFLLSESPAEVARVLNRVASLDDIDRAHAGIASMARQTQGHLSHAEVEVTRLTETLKEFDHLPDMKARMEALERAEKRIQGTKQNVTHLTKLVEGLEQGGEELKRIARTTKLRKPLNELLAIGHDLQTRQKGLVEFRQKMESLVKVQAKKRVTEEQIRDWKHTFEDVMPEECPLCGQEVK